MPRTFLYATILILAVFVLSATFVLGNGGSPSEAEMPVSIHDLATFTDRYRGERVTTEGVLRGHDESTDDFVVEDGGLRVAVTSPAPDALRSLEGQRVIVTGRFDVEPGTGRYIEADRITPTQ